MKNRKYLIFVVLSFMLFTSCESISTKKYTFTFPGDSREVSILLKPDKTAIIESPSGSQQISWLHTNLGDLNYIELEFGKYGYIKDEIFYLSYEDMSAKRDGITMRKISTSSNLYNAEDEDSSLKKDNIAKKEQEENDLSWLVGTWMGHNNRTRQDCVITLKSNGHGSFLMKGGDYDTVYILGDYYISDNGRLCISGGKNR